MVAVTFIPFQNGAVRRLAPGAFATVALFRGEKYIARGDWIAFLTTLLAIPLWVVTSDPLWSVLLVTAIDAIAYYPTFCKSYARPDEELAFNHRDSSGVEQAFAGESGPPANGVPQGQRWDDLFHNGPRASEDFMVECEQPSAEQREPL